MAESEAGKMINTDKRLKITERKRSAIVTAADRNISGDIVIPEGITHIPNNAFYGCSNISSIKLPSTIKKIGTNAFTFCSGLKSVDFSAVLNLKTIEKKAFYNSGLKAVIIPECVETIGDCAFAGTKIDAITIPKTVQKLCYRAFSCCDNLRKVCFEGGTELDEGVFYHCESLEEIVLPSNGLIPEDTCCYCRALKKAVIPEGVSMLGVSAFAYCSSLDNIILPDSLRIISAHAFLYNTSLKTINLGTCHVESININAFGDIAAKSLLLPRTLTGQSQFPIVSECKVTTFEVDDDNPYFCSVDGVVFSKDMTLLLQYPPGKSGRYSVPDTVKEIGAEAFAYSQIEEVYIPDSVTEIGIGAFEHCNMLKAARLSESLETLEERLFCGDAELSSVNIPNECKTIDAGAFSGCGLQGILSLPDSITEVGNSAFNSCHLSEIVFPENCMLGYSAFDAGKVYLPSTINTPSQAFECGAQKNSVVYLQGYRLPGNYIERLTGSLDP